MQTNWKISPNFRSHKIEKNKKKSILIRDRCGLTTLHTTLHKVRNHPGIIDDERYSAYYIPTARVT
jgi:hypothetical protein